MRGLHSTNLLRHHCILTSLTLQLLGSNGYTAGDTITTSLITSDTADGAVVQTTSGSKYYLAPKRSVRPPPARKAPANTVPESSLTKKAEDAVAKAKRGATISLGFFNFGFDDEESQTPPAAPKTMSKVAPNIVSQAPRGVPTLSKWRQNRDGSISAVISGSRAYQEGESITTSAITSDAADGAVVQTTSGSR